MAAKGPAAAAAGAPNCEFAPELDLFCAKLEVDLPPHQLPGHMLLVVEQPLALSAARETAIQ